MTPLGLAFLLLVEGNGGYCLTVVQPVEVVSFILVELVCEPWRPRLTWIRVLMLCPFSAADKVAYLGCSYAKYHYYEYLM